MEFQALQSLALTVAQERSRKRVLDQMVTGLLSQPGVALARLWLNEPGDICGTCRMRSECRDQNRCLHLVASAGKPLNEPPDAWSNITGTFQRFPLYARKIGQIGATGNPLLINNFADSEAWVAHPEWARREQIHCFAGQPLIFRGEILGVLAVFSRTEITHEQFSWLRMFADYGAVTITNCRAFTEIEQLKEKLQLENEYLRESVKEALSFGEIVGASPAIKKVLSAVEMVAPTDVSVLITGESGTGKELIASAIHERSRRRAQPMVKVNCGAIPRELFESEFFGHIRGAFTGAVKDRVGRFQLADGGTLFLDEVGEIPIELQSKLLRTLQEGTFERIGDDQTRRTNVRIVAATNRNLEAEIAAGRFREDLYYRLCVFPLQLPPLRERPEDIPALVDHFIRQARHRLHCPYLKLSPDQMAKLQAYPWPGNIREMENVIERAAILSTCGRLEFDEILPQSVTSRLQTTTELHRVAAPAKPLSKEAVRAQERETIRAALEQSGGKIYGPGGAAERLGLPGSTLASRMKTLGIGK